MLESASSHRMRVPIEQLFSHADTAEQMIADPEFTSIFSELAAD
jgi:hypothetical protein